MHKIYFENRCIVICSPDDSVLEDTNAIIFKPGGTSDIRTFAGIFQCSGTLPKVYIPSEDCEQVYKDLCSGFKEVNAGGGLVSNKRGDYLLISRNGLWDLPKGHQEPGEDIVVTALREVREETGLDDLSAEELICITDHCYFRDGLWHLKHTWWFAMTCCTPTELVPQKEEDISEAEWVSKSSLPSFLKKTYPSIIEVFDNAKT